MQIAIFTVVNHLNARAGGINWASEVQNRPSTSYSLITYCLILGTRNPEIRRTSPLGNPVLSLVRCVRVAILVLVAASSGAAQELGPVLYNTWEGLCSISPESGAKPHCIGGKRYEEASWQPHGNRIVTESRGGLVFLNSNGQLISRAVGKSGGRPIWSPDGKYVYAINYALGRAVERWDAFGKHRIVLPVTGLEDQQLRSGDVPSPMILQMISLSPSGKRAALLTRDFKEMLIAHVGDKVLSVQQIVPHEFSYVSQSVWLDEEHLLFIGKRDSMRGELWEINVQSGELRRRGIDGLWLRDSVALSPDGRSVIVTGVRDGQEVSWNLWQYSFETSRLIRLTNGAQAEDVYVSWRQ